MKKDILNSLGSAIIFMIIYVGVDILLDGTLVSFPKYILVFLMYIVVYFILIRIVKK
ncbi:hypothetical protein [Carnobacterium divergens]|uniref:hypothetical protein n=1 Tax=Carnobacterium divergens TaxID=2748 RepID=UPI00142F4575|nr:hypothetical protein [Carnobacterium divergens]